MYMVLSRSCVFFSLRLFRIRSHISQCHHRVFWQFFFFLFLKLFVSIHLDDVTKMSFDDVVNSVHYLVYAVNRKVTTLLCVHYTSANRNKNELIKF